LQEKKKGKGGEEKSDGTKKKERKTFVSLLKTKDKNKKAHLIKNNLMHKKTRTNKNEKKNPQEHRVHHGDLT